jgi:hypothetical protein
VLYGADTGGGVAQDAGLSWAHTTTVLTIGAAALVGTISFASAATGALVTKATPPSDLATSDIVIQSQAPFATATVNPNPGNIRLNVSAPTESGTHGSIFFQDSGTTWLTFAKTLATASMIFAAADAAPTIGQFATTSGDGAELFIFAQSTSASGGTGGELFLEAGSGGGTGGIGGNVLISSGSGTTGGNILLNASAATTTGNIQFQNAAATWLTFSITGVQTTLLFAATDPSIFLEQATTSSANGVSLNVQAQRTTLAGGTGGALNLLGGDGGNGAGVGGNVNITAGSATSGGATGGTITLNPGAGFTTGGDVQLFDSFGNLSLRVDGQNSEIKISQPLIGDDVNNDPLRFGVTLPISLAGRSTNLTLTNVQYQNQTIEFNGTPAINAVFSIVFPNVTGWAKIVDLSAVDMTSSHAEISVAAGSSTALLQGPTPKYWVWYDGTTIHAGPMSVGIMQTFFENAAGTTLTTAFQNLTTTINLTTNVGDKVIIHAESLYSSGTLSSDTITYRLVVDGATVLITDALASSTASGTFSYARTFEWVATQGTHSINFQAETTSVIGTPKTVGDTLTVLRSAV